MSPLASLKRINWAIFSALMVHLGPARHDKLVEFFMAAVARYYFGVENIRGDTEASMAPSMAKRSITLLPWNTTGDGIHWKWISCHCESSLRVLRIETAHLPSS
ncbi:hypothetical protein TNCV_4888721 [Trichonephila clavipes]|nr:hypothetical protein TNCV_4888721 [Trichonephila clavipes]